MNLVPTKGVLLLGSTSEIGIAILKRLKVANGTQLILVGRDAQSIDFFRSWPGKVSFLPCDLSNVEQIREVVSTLGNRYVIDLAVIASAHLPQELLDSDFDSVHQTFSINATGIASFLSSLASMMSRSGGTLIYISTVAAMRPRIKNFTYGASKLSIDFFVLGLAAKYKKDGLDIRVLRPGYVHSKLSKGFEVAPFSTTPQSVAKDLVSGLNGHRRIIYSPRILRLVMNLLKLLPSRIFNKL